MTKNGWIAGLLLVIVILFFVYNYSDRTNVQPTIPKDSPVISNVSVENIDILILESFPVQVNAIVTGLLPDSCSLVDTTDANLSESTFTIIINTLKPADAVCDPSPSDFEEVIPLDVLGLLSGEYIVKSGSITKTFTLSQDNIPLEPELE
ncbi:hypothetical protein ACFL2V_09770 [Pseudomonadota bacterium]